MKLLIPALLAASLFIAAPSAAHALEYLSDEVSYNESIPTPEQFFGFEIGEWHLNPEQSEAYLRELARSSDRVTLKVTGRTYEQKPLLLLTITAPDNLARIETIRHNHLDPDRAPGATDPVILWMGYSVHGDEASGANAALLFAYHLAAAEGEAIEAQLRNTVVLVDPMLNPDGMGRFARWVNMYKGVKPVPDRESSEHNQAWPGGRGNHYWFDLNRDWLLLQHPESRARIAEFHAWRPHVLTDFHEMGTDATYFFQPGVPSRQNPLTPAANFDLTAKIAEFHAKALDGIGSRYYSKESFDDFYFGKGSTYPDINGGIGILFEQASARGHLSDSVNGPLSFPFAIRNQLTTSFSSLEAANALRPQLLAYQRDFFRQADLDAQQDRDKGYLFGDEGNRTLLAEMVKMLRSHDIEVLPLAEDITVGQQRYRAGLSWVVPLRQRQYRLIKSLFETRTEFTDNTFYDVSAWTLPLAFNVNATTLDKTSLARVKTGSPEPAPTASEAVISSKVAYAIPGDDYGAIRALNDLLADEIRVQVATKGFTARVGGVEREFAPGSLVIPVSGQPVDAEAVRKKLMAASKGIAVYPIDSGLSLKGVDLGSPSLVPVSLPKPLLLTGSGVSSVEAGEIWHLLDQRAGLPLVMRPASLLEEFQPLALAPYTHLLMVSGEYPELDEAQIAGLRDWIARGGTLVASRYAAEWVAKLGLTQPEIPASDGDSATGADSGAPDEDTPVAERRDYRDLEASIVEPLIGGAIFAADLDTSHPIAFGYQRRRLPVFRQGTLILESPKDPFATVASYEADPLLAGYSSADNQAKIGGSAALVAERFGKGAVILFADNPAFRGFWLGTSRLYLNSLYFSNTFASSLEYDDNDE